LVYEAFRDKQPILEYDVVGKKIYSYSGKDYINTLSSRTRDETLNQYENACANNQFILFVKDKKNKKLKSYIFSTTKLNL